MNTTELHKKVLQTTGPLLEEKGYIAFVDIFMKLGYLDVGDYEKWRRGKIPYLEKVIKVNLKKIQFILNSVRQNCERGNLKASRTVYKSWGKGPKKSLRFSKTGATYVEDLYSTLYLRPKQTDEKSA